MRLTLLILAGNIVHFIASSEAITRLVERKADAVFHTLDVRFNDPGVVKNPRAFSGFAAAGDAFDLDAVLLQISFDVDGFEHRLVDDLLVLDGEFQKDREALISHALVFAGAADRDIVVAIAPVIRQSLIETVRPLRDKEEVEIGALLHHCPGFRPPFVRSGMEEVGGEAGHDGAVFGLDLILFLSVLLQG